MRMNRFGRLLLRLPILLLPLLAAACATTNGDSTSVGPSHDRTMDLIALAAGAAGLIAIGVLMYVDNQE
jgi:hypothetical protein